MNSKLTLSINQIVVDDAKEYAKSTGRSLSNIIEEYLKSLSKPPKLDRGDSSMKLVKELRGSVKMPADFTSYEALLQDALIEKHLK